MNQLVARVRGRKKPFFYKLLSDKKYMSLMLVK